MKKNLTLIVIAGVLMLPALAVAQDSQLTSDEVAKLKKMLAKDHPDVTVMKDLDLDFYGFLRMDSAWTNSETGSFADGSIHFWAEPETDNNRNDDEFTITARVTRFGLNIKGPGDDTMRTSGKLEIDFAGGGSKTASAPRMRHAYLKFDFPEKNFSILAGQASDVISPLFPPTNDFGVLWDGGNLGARRTQLRLTQVVPVNDEVSFKFETAAATTLGQINLDGEETGDDSGLPSIQARVSFTMPAINNSPATFGVSGHYGTEEYDIAAGSDSDKDFHSWTLCADMSLPVTKTIKATGEFYTGTNTRAYFGGIGQGVTIAGTDVNEIDAMGGWFGLTYTPAPKWIFGGGYGIDTVDTDDLADDGTARELNATAFVNVRYKPFKAVTVGVEAAYHETEWHENSDGQGMRASMFMQLNF